MRPASVKVHVHLTPWTHSSPPPNQKMATAQAFQLRGTNAPLRASRPAPRCVARSGVRVFADAKQKTVLIGLAADSGCGKSTFMRRMTNLFGGNSKPPAGGNPDSNTLIRCALIAARSDRAPGLCPCCSLKTRTRVLCHMQDSPTSGLFRVRGCVLSATGTDFLISTSSTLHSELTTVLCLDDYHCHDREGRKKAKVTALAPEAQNFGACT